MQRRPARLGDRLCPLSKANRSNFLSDEQLGLILSDHFGKPALRKPSSNIAVCSGF
jgi:hypothetical protein